MSEKNYYKRKIVETPTLDSGDIGKLPPQSTDLEEVVLGAMLLEKETINTVVNILSPEYFYKEQNGKIFKAIISLFKANEPIDILTVTHELKRNGEIEEVGGAYYISKLTNRIASSANIEFHARIVAQKYLLRELIRYGTEIIKSSYETSADPFDVIEAYNKKINSLTNFIKSSVKSVGDIFAEVIDDITEVQEKGAPTGILSGFENIDKVTGGWQKGTLNILAARPGMGKTALALALAKYPAIALNKPVAIFSLEMTSKQLVGRLAASESGISSSKINQKTVNNYELQSIGVSCSKLIDSPVYIDDTPNIKYSTLRSISKKLVQDHGIEMIIIDYLQLMAGEEKGNREQEISFISRNLKALSKELDLPIICLSQLSRKVEERTGADAKRPQLSDLRESGAIEQDADNVMFLFRPAYYDMFPNGYQYGAFTLETQNLLLLDFAKGREIRICEVPLKFFGETMLIMNYNYSSGIIYSSDTTKESPLENNNNFLNT